ARSWLMVRVPRLAPSESAAGAGKRRRWSAERRAPAIASGGDTPRKRVSGGFRRPPLGGCAKPPRFSALRFPHPGSAKAKRQASPAPRQRTGAITLALARTGQARHARRVHARRRRAMAASPESITPVL